MQLRITTTDIGHAQAALQTVFARIRNPRPVLAQFGVHMLRSIQQTFDAGGRPTAWPPSLRVLTRGGKTLIKSGRLKNSFVAALVDERTLVIGTNVQYHPPHELGFDGTVQIPQHLRRVKSRDVRQTQVRTSAKTGRQYTASMTLATGFTVVKAHAAHLRIPARPALVVQEDDLRVLVGLGERHLAVEGA